MDVGYLDATHCFFFQKIILTENKLSLIGSVWFLFLMACQPSWVFLMSILEE